MVQWVFETLTRDGGASGEATPNAVEAGGWSTPEELLVREAIQNSVDAATEDHPGPVRVIFRLNQFVEDDKNQLLQHLALEPFVERLQAFGDQLTPGNVIEKRNDPSAPVHLLYIEDYNTKGLGGGIRDRVNGHFFRLLFLFGEGSKADNDDGSGGSFGFGKGVYAHNSNVRMIFVFSVFEATEATNHNWARLLGCAYLPGHSFDDETWTGRAWFGVPTAARDAQAPYPIVDDEAVAFAERLGFAPRNRDEFGTSILIVGCDSQEGVITAEKLRRAAETWWWPRLIDGDLTMEIVEHGVRTPGVDPAGRLDLQPFIRCRNAIRRGHGDDDVKLRQFNRKHGLDLGELALTAIGPDHSSCEALNRDVDASDDRQGTAPVHKSVAYIRKPGMVVTYRTWSISSTMSAVGTFEADSAVDRHLKLSEPKEHDRWDPHSRRLDRIANGHAVVKAIEEGIRKRVRDFLKELQPPAPPPKSGLAWLGKRLGEMLAPQGKGNPPHPEGDRGSVSIYTDSKPTIVFIGDEVRLEARYSIALKPDVELEQAQVTFSPRLNVLEGDVGSRGDLIPITVQLNGDAAVSGIAPDVQLLLTEERRVIHVISDPFSPDWAVSIHIEVSDTGTESE
jgi:hypothetical protein